MVFLVRVFLLRFRYRRKGFLYFLESLRSKLRELCLLRGLMQLWYLFQFKNVILFLWVELQGVQEIKVVIFFNFLGVIQKFKCQVVSSNTGKVFLLGLLDVGVVEVEVQVLDNQQIMFQFEYISYEYFVFYFMTLYFEDIKLVVICGFLFDKFKQVREKKYLLFVCSL